MSPSVAVIGSHVNESLSPPMQRAAFVAAGVDLDYVARTVTRAELAAVFPELRAAHVGLNVTIPLKEAVVPLLDELSSAATAAGSVNTVAFRREGAFGDSTDGPGFMRALAREHPGPVARALVLGTGGAARAVAAELTNSGTAVQVAGRNREAGFRLSADLSDGEPPGMIAFAGRLAAEVLQPLVEAADLLVNATPAGRLADPAVSPLPDSVALPSHTVVFDLVYRPRRTRLLERARASGCPTVEGIEMLVEQGALSFELWTGLPAPVEVMRRAALAALEAAGDDRSARV